jgi:hypothetical protein
MNGNELLRCRIDSEHQVWYAGVDVKFGLFTLYELGRSSELLATIAVLLASC